MLKSIIIPLPSKAGPTECEHYRTIRIRSQFTEMDESFTEQFVLQEMRNLLTNKNMSMTPI